MEETIASMFHLAFTYFVLYAVPSFILIKMVQPFVTLQLTQQKNATLVGGSKDKHWLFGHVIKYPLSEFSGLHKLIKTMKECPAIFPYWTGPFRMTLSFHHPDVAKTILSKSYAKATGYRKFLFPMLRNGLVVSHGEIWKRHRRLLTPIFHFNILKEHCMVFNRNCEALIKTCDKAASSGEVTNIGALMLDTTYINMMECIMSQKVKSVDDEEDCSHLVTKASALIFKRWFSPLQAFDFIYRRTDSGKTFFDVVDKVYSKVGKIIKERRQLLNSMDAEDFETTEIDDMATGKSFVVHKRKGKNVDFLDVLLQTKDQDGVGLTDAEISDEVATFFSAGQETVGSGMAWTLYFLSKNLECQQKCREEINEVLGNKTEIDIGDVNSLRYLTQCVKESLRLMPTIHIIGRTMNDDVTISHRYNEGKDIKLVRGQNVMLNIFMLHRHPDIWENPSVYDPERFTPENSKARQTFAFLPFSAGPRNCLGQHFAMLQIRVVVSHILRHFEVYRDSDTLEPKPVPGVSLHSANGVSVKLRRLQ